MRHRTRATGPAPRHRTRAAGPAPRRRTCTEDVAAIALFLAGDNAAVINGSAHSIDGGWSAA